MNTQFATSTQTMAAPNIFRLLLADDHPVVLDGLTNLLASESDLEVMGRAQNGRQLLDMLRSKTVDMVITDIGMPEMDGIETTRQIRAEFPDIRILVLSMHETADYITKVLQAGANGYLVKNSSKREVLDAIRSILSGKSYYSPVATRAVMDQMQSGEPASIELSEREREIVCLICDELTTREIAEKLFLSFHTVEKHRKNIIGKLGVRNTAGLVKWAIQEGVCK